MQVCHRPKIGANMASSVYRHPLCLNVQICIFMHARASVRANLKGCSISTLLRHVFMCVTQDGCMHVHTQMCVAQGSFNEC